MSASLKALLSAAESRVEPVGARAGTFMPIALCTSLEALCAPFDPLHLAHLEILDRYHCELAGLQAPAIEVAASIMRRAEAKESINGESL